MKIKLKEILYVLYILIICWSSFVLVSKAATTDFELNLEFRAASELENLCKSVDFYGISCNGYETYWEEGRLTMENENGEVYDVPITDVVLECETLTKEIINYIMQLRHLQSLTIYFSSVTQTQFPIHCLKLTKLEIHMSPEEEFVFPKSWLKNIGKSPTIHTLNLDISMNDEVAFLREIAKMKQLRSLTLDCDGENLLPYILPLKNTLRELVFTSNAEAKPEETLKEFAQLQVLSITCFDFQTKNIDLFLKGIQHLPIRCLWLTYGKIGQKGEEILCAWDSLQEIGLPNDFPLKRFAILKKIEIPVLLTQRDGSKKIEKRRKFFQGMFIQDDGMLRPYRLDEQGNYIHWADIKSGIWM